VKRFADNKPVYLFTQISAMFCMLTVHTVSICSLLDFRTNIGNTHTH